jgi:hypothetical protein
MKYIILTEDELKKLTTFMKNYKKDEYKRALAIIQRSKFLSNNSRSFIFPSAS